MRQDQEADNHILFSYIASLATDEGRTRALGLLPPSNVAGLSNRTFPAERSKKLIPPDNHLLCFDHLYWMATNAQYEWENEWSPMWNFVGKYMRWSDTLRSTARNIVARTLDVAPSSIMVPLAGDLDFTPGSETETEYDTQMSFEELEVRDKILHPFVVIHARHGQFINHCFKTPGAVCFPKIDELERNVKEVINELRTTRGIDVRSEDVIVTSDEKDEVWWDQIKAKGWKRVVIEEEDLPEGQLGIWYATHPH